MQPPKHTFEIALFSILEHYGGCWASGLINPARTSKIETPQFFWFETTSLKYLWLSPKYIFKKITCVVVFYNRFSLGNNRSFSKSPLNICMITTLMRIPFSQLYLKLFKNFVKSKFKKKKILIIKKFREIKSSKVTQSGHRSHLSVRDPQYVSWSDMSIANFPWPQYLQTNVRFEHSVFCKNTQILIQCSEIRGLCLMKWPSEKLQNFPYFWNKKTNVVFFVFHFLLLYYFP